MSDSMNKTTSILLVDDEQFTRTSIRRRLERLGLPILEAENGRQALEILNAHRLDDA